jgi:hypothetical protein
MTGMLTDLDAVELVRPVPGDERAGEWPAGTRGTLLEPRDGAGYVEIVEGDGTTADLLVVPLDVLRPAA